MKEERNLTGYPSIDKPWLKYYSEEAISAPLPECTIYAYMYDNNKDYPDDIAINYLGRKITYRQLFENIDKTAAAFQALSVKSGEIVTVALPSIPEALYAVYALNRIGAVANMIHPLAGKQELINYLNEVESRIAVVFDGTMRILEDGLEKTKVEEAIVVSAGDSLPLGIRLLYRLKNKPLKIERSSVCCTWKQFINKGKNTSLEPVHKDPETMAIISHTGGTTGEPKGCMLSDYNVNAEILQIVKSMSNNRQETMMAVLPPFINYSLVNSMLEPICIGLVTVLIPKYEPDKFAEYVTKYKVNHVNSIPAYWEAVLQIPSIEKYDFSKLRFLFYGGESMPEETEKAVNRILERCGTKQKLQKGLGMTEITSAATATYERVNMPGSAGIPLVKLNCKIVDPTTNEELKYRQAGEICFSGATVMMGYYKHSEETSEIIRIHSDGIRWLHTGDIGYITENGVIFVTGRIKRILATKGTDGVATKMFPDRIESVINKHPSVNLSCVIGVPDKDRINYPKAVIELNEGCTPSEELKADIINFCKGKLPDYQIPDEIEFCDALPRTDRGKVDYRALEKNVG